LPLQLAARGYPRRLLGGAGITSGSLCGGTVAAQSVIVLQRRFERVLIEEEEVGFAVVNKKKYGILGFP